MPSVPAGAGAAARRPARAGPPAGARAAVLALAAAAAVASPAIAQAPHTHHHGFQGAQQWSAYFDDPARDEWQKPHQVIQALGLAPGAVVADVGAGTGYFSVRLAHMNAAGRVYAADTEPDMVRHLAERARREGLANLVAVQASPSDPRLPEKVDCVLLVDVYHHLDDRERWLRGLARSLKPGARVAIVDFRKDSPIGPPPAERIAPEAVVREMARAGYALAASHDFLARQFFLVFSRP